MSASGRQRAVAFVVVWLLFLAGTLGFELIRTFADTWMPVRRVGFIEEAIFGGWPTTFLQRHLYERDLVALDYACFLIHGLWFGLPFAFGLVTMVQRRERLVELFTWVLVASYIAGIVYVLTPVEPPWSEGGVPRVLYIRNFGNYSTEIDPNPYSAMPSFHAALPAIISIFFFMRGGPRLRFWAWLVGIYSLLVGFAIVYMGEHFVIDVMAGYAVAGLAAYLCASERMLRLWFRLPGDPVGRASRLNQRYFARRPRVLEPAPARLPRAA
jgi:membrane-associated phospholipid phosphatase